MKQRTMNILIIISMAFNIAFVGSFFYHKIKFGRGPGPRMDHPEPPPRFREKFKNTMEDARPEQKEFMDASKEFFKMLTSEEFEEGKATELMSVMIDKQMAMERKIGEGLISMHSEMTPEELKTARNFVNNRRDNFNKRKFDRPNKKMNEEKPMRREK